MLNDLRYSLRSLRRNRGLSLAIVLCLALGMGATSAIFTLVHAALLKPLPFAEADRLVVLYDVVRSPDGTVREYLVSSPNFDAWRRQNREFEDLVAIQVRNVSLTGDGEPVRLQGAAVTANCFAALGVSPILGRGFSREEDQVGYAAPVVVISHGLWQRRFGGEPTIVGESLVLDGRSVTVIGIMPPGFGFPEGLEGYEPQDLWTPLGLDPDRMPDRRWHDHLVVGRLRSGSSLARAQSHLEKIAEQLARDDPETHAGWSVRGRPLRQALVSDEVETALFLLAGAVGFLLLIACINVANLLLARGAARGGEVALRMALGSGRGRLLRLVLTESVLLALVGAAVGLALAQLAVSPLVALSGVAVPALREVVVDPPVLAFTFLVAVTTGLLFGLAPALKLLASDLRQVLLEGSTRAGVGRWGRRFQTGLVVGQIALTLVLLVGAGLMIRTYRQLQRIDPGFPTENLLTLRTYLSPVRFPEPHQLITFTDRVLAELRSVPGVEAASGTMVVPIGDFDVGDQFTIRGGPPLKPGEMLDTHHRVVATDFFATLGIEIVEGRPLNAGDTADSPLSVVVSRHLAESNWPGRSPLGRQVKRGGPDSQHPWMTVVGVAEDVRDSGLDGEIGNTWYLPYPQTPTRWLRLVLRTAAEPPALVPAVRQAVRSVDPDQPVYGVTTVDAMVYGSLADERFNSVLLALFAGVGLVLAVLGLYGVMSYSVHRRSTEIGIRMALGARAREVRGRILWQGATLTAIGLAIGLVLSFVVYRFFASLLFEIGPSDPLTIAAMVIFLAVVAGLATYLPARRATRVDPAVVLRSL